MTNLNYGGGFTEEQIKEYAMGNELNELKAMQLESILRKIVIHLPNFALNAFVVGLTPDERKLLDEFYNERYMIPLPKDEPHENL